MAREQRGIVSVTTLPPEEGLRAEVRHQEDDGIMLEGVTNASGAWKVEHGYADDVPVALVLTREAVGDQPEKELIRCRVSMGTLNPMECLMLLPRSSSMTPIELDKAWREANRKLQARGVAHPDPEAVGRLAFGPRAGDLEEG